MNFKGRVLAILVGAALLATVSTTTTYATTTYATTTHATTTHATTTSGRIFYALRADGTIVSFDPASPGVTTVIPVSLPVGETIVSIDLRSTGELYALTDRGTLLRVAPNVGTPQPVGASPILLTIGQARVDIDPSPEAVRIVTTGGQDYAFDPDTGEVLSFASGSPVAALAASFGGAAAGGVRYVIDPVNDLLLVEPGLDAIGSLGVDFSSPGAFDIVEETKAAYAVTIPNNYDLSWLYSVHLYTGRATPIGPIGSDLPIVDLAAG